MRAIWLRALLVAAACTSPAAADVPMFSFDPPDEGLPTERGTDGFRFKPNVDIQVTELGYYDQDQDGFFVATHPVAIYDFASRAQLTKVSVSTDSPLDGAFRYAPINPLTLQAGTSYVLAAYTPPLNNSNADNPLPLLVASEITFEGYRFFAGGTDVTFPTETFGTPFFGPNLKFHALNTGVAGDTNADGVVDLTDLNNVRNQFGAAGNPVLGDTAPFDGVVDLEDLNAVRNNFGVAGSSVPEPASLSLAGGFAVLLVAARFRHALISPRR